MKNLLHIPVLATLAMAATVLAESPDPKPAFPE